MRDVFLGEAGQYQRPLKSDPAIVNVERRARIEQRLASRSARAPELGHILAGVDAEVIVERIGRHFPQLLFVEDRDFGPFLRVGNAVEVDGVEFTLEERRFLGLSNGVDAAFFLRLLQGGF